MSETRYADAGRRQDKLSDRQHRDDDLHLRSMNAVTGYNLHGTCGFIGHAEGFLIDDTDWTVRFINVDTRKLVARQTCPDRAAFGKRYPAVRKPGQSRFWPADGHGQPRL